MPEVTENRPHPVADRPGFSGQTGLEASIPPGPVSCSERFGSIDMLRGVALLGILQINVLWLGLPATPQLNPSVAGGFTGVNFAAWIFGYLVFEEKMITIFSMLFGAGLVLMTDRMQHRGHSAAAFFYRRSAILLSIGLAHAYLLWQGDILVSYALCGMLVYPLRKLSPRNLLVIGLLVLLPSAALMRRESAVFAQARDAALRVQMAEDDGRTPSDADLELARAWDDIRQTFRPTPEQVSRSIQENRDASYLQLARSRASSAFELQTRFFATILLWTVSGRMLIGMALMKLGVFAAQRSLRFYVTLAIVGYGLGLPIVALGAYRLVQNDFDVVYVLGGGTEFNEFGSLLVAMGHVGTVVSIYKLEWATWLTTRLAAVGRMALSNYLIQSLICTTIFNGYGFGMFGRLDRIELFGIVAAIWMLQLLYSPLWLKQFRFGPVEWLWRSLTYGKRQPMWNAG
jgi:uncharacterized protein